MFMCIASLSYKEGWVFASNCQVACHFSNSRLTAKFPEPVCDQRNQCVHCMGGDEFADALAWEGFCKIGGRLHILQKPVANDCKNQAIAVVASVSIRLEWQPG